MHLTRLFILTGSVVCFGLLGCDSSNNQDGSAQQNTSQPAASQIGTSQASSTATSAAPIETWALGLWETLDTVGLPGPRHEATFIEVDGLFYALGGRRIQPVSIFDPQKLTWQNGAQPPVELHHFQAIAYQKKIWVIGAMTGKFPDERPLDHIYVYDTVKDEWSQGSEIPVDRRRGGAGAVEHLGKFYIVSGIQRGHMGGFVPWLDQFDPETNEWKILPDAPRSRDHFQAAVIDGVIYAAGGRNTSKDTEQVFELTIKEVDAYNISQATWTTLPTIADLPTQRAGTTTIALNGELIVIGGETAGPRPAHTEVEALNLTTLQWRSLSPLNEGRHGTGAAVFGNKLWTCCGSGATGGRPELTTTEAASIID